MFPDTKEKIMPRKFRTRLAKLREARGIERMEIVRKADISYTTIHSWENDLLKSIDAEKLWQVMEILECTSIDEMLEFVEVPE